MKKQLSILRMLLLGAAVLSLSSCNTAGESAETTNTETVVVEEQTPPVKTTPQKLGLQVGDTAPDFTLQNVDGKMVSLGDFPEAKGFIVTFTCNTCPYSTAYEDRIIALHRQFAPKGYPVVAVQPNDPDVKKGDSFVEMQRRAKEKQYPFPYLMDDGSVTAVYGATRTPEIYILDKDLTLRYTGAIDDNAQDAAAVQVKYVEKAVAALEAGQAPEPNFVKAIGCTIKPKTPKQS